MPFPSCRCSATWRSGEYRQTYLGVKIPPTNIQDYHLDQARGFAGQLAQGLFLDVGALLGARIRRRRVQGPGSRERLAPV